MFDSLVNGIKDIGRSQYKDGTAPTGAFHGSRTKDRKAQTYTSEREATARLFDRIGESLCVPEQADTVQAENSAGSLERPETSSASFRNSGVYSTPFTPQNLRENVIEFRCADGGNFEIFKS